MLKELQQTQLNESIDIYVIDAPLGDKFLPTRKLGAGAYGVVIEARDLESGNIVALKILDSEKCDAQEVLLEAQCL
jgi:serine/threonine protein kinase